METVETPLDPPLVSHVISSARPSSPLFFPTREEGLGTRLL